MITITISTTKVIIISIIIMIVFSGSPSILFV